MVKIINPMLISLLYVNVFVYESVNLSERETWDQPSTERSAI